MPIRKSRRALYPPRAHWITIRNAILTRARHCCEGTLRFPFCRVMNGLPHRETGSRVVLTIAHLDHDPRNNREENLRALCQRCHLDWDRHQHAKNRRVREAEEGHPVLFVMEEQ